MKDPIMEILKTGETFYITSEKVMDDIAANHDVDFEWIEELGQYEITPNKVNEEQIHYYHDEEEDTYDVDLVRKEINFFTNDAELHELNEKTYKTEKGALNRVRKLQQAQNHDLPIVSEFHFSYFDEKL